MKIEVISDVRIEATPHHSVGQWCCGDMEKYAKALESWAKEFEDFVRDHRSQDQICLDVIRDKAIVCEHCGYDWEVDDDGCPACCDKAVEEWESEQTASIVLSE